MSKTKIGSVILRVLTILATLLLIVVGSILIFIFLPSFSQTQTIIVPNVVGKNLITAQNMLYKEKLRVSKSYVIHTCPKNYIIAQNPLPGTKVKPGRTIELKISSGKGDVVSMPDIQNMHLTKAKHKLARLSYNTLQIGRLSYIYSSLEKDYVVAQSPLPRVKILQNSEVNLLISKGKRPISFYMPELIGMKLDEAIKLIKKIGLKITRVQEEICDGYERGTILDQKPKRGYRVTEGDGLTLIIANKTTNSPLF